MSGMIKDAPPTSPGGMSQKALADELVSKHGWTKAAVKPYLPLKKWAELIDLVIEERKNREAEQAQQIMAEHEGEPVGQVEEALVDAGLDPMFEAVGAAMFDAETDTIEDLDPEEMMAELISTREADEQHRLQHGLLIKEHGTLNYIFDGHAGAGPSSSERWMHCTASLGASREFLETLTPNQQENFARANLAARQGTTAHAAAETEARVILGELTDDEAALTMLELAITPETDGEAYDEEMAEYITEYVDLIKSYAQERGDDHVLIEQRVAAAVLLTDRHEGEVYEIPGSADMISLPTPDDQTLVVADLKYGNGIWVGVDENSQARIYALGALALLADDEGNLITDVTTVRLHIVQPRMDGIKTWEESLDDLLTWRDEVLAPALTKALYGQAEGATFEPSEGACQFCPARGGCAALAESRVEAAADLFDTIVDHEYAGGEGFPETSALPNDRLGALYTQISGLQDIFKDIKAEAERRMYRGEAVPGLVLVNYQPKREWIEGADEAFAEVPDLWSVPKMLSPTQAIKLAESNPEEWDIDGLKEWVETPDKRPVVAKVGDRRKVWEGKPPEAMFDIEEEQ